MSESPDRTSPRMRWILDRIEPGSGTLDIGFASEGEPVLFRALRERNAGGATIGVDLNRQGVLDRAEPLTAVGDAFRLPFPDGAFDAVVLAEVLEHIAEGNGILAESARVLRPGGRLIVTTPNPYYLNRWISRWLLRSRRRTFDRESVQFWMGAPDHELNWEPISLAHRLLALEFEIATWVTLQHGIPLLRRFIPALGGFDLPFWPFNRVGGYLCLDARLSG